MFASLFSLGSHRVTTSGFSLSLSKFAYAKSCGNETASLKGVTSFQERHTLLFILVYCFF